MVSVAGLPGATERALAERFERLLELGGGANGVVYAARDHVRGGRVALKTLRIPGGEALYRLKREFRQLAGITHPNIVELYDLVVAEDETFYTMELVEGVDWVVYCRGGEASERGFDEKRVRSAMAQLVSGVQAMHAAGKLHRDLKPSNVLVTAEGRVVILDFGLVADLLGDPGTMTNAIAGTVLYMAPEQMELGGAFGPASDWYSVGVMLYEVLSGACPFEGEVADIAQRKRREAPPPLPPHVPEDLRGLCLQLLDRHPEQRTHALLPWVNAEVQPGCESPGAKGSARAGLLLGRDLERAELRRWVARATAGQPVVGMIRGESGIGKTALVEALLAEPGLEASTILRGRCREREHIPYRAIDDVIDHLSQHWRALYAADAAYLLPRDSDLLRQLFPVLGRVAEVASAPEGLSDLSPQDRRLRALDALREVLQRLTRKTPTVVFIDDFQWVDADTLALLRYVMRAPDPPPILLLLSTRPDAGSASDLGEFLGPLPTDMGRDLELVPLGDDASRRLALAALGGEGPSPRAPEALDPPESGEPDISAEWVNPAVAERVASEGAGNPFLIEQLAEHVARTGSTDDVSVGNMVQRKLEELPAPARSTVELVCVADEPLPEAVVLAATGSESAALSSAFELRLLRRAPNSQSAQIEPYHDRIREAVTAALGSERRRGLFERLAHELEGWPECSLELLAGAWLEAGHRDKAFRYAHRAAQAASDDLAFERAAKLYQKCITLTEPGDERRLDLQSAAADALANAGHGPAAAQLYFDVARRSTGDRKVELQFAAAKQLLHSGRVEAGIEAMRPVLEACDLKMPKSFPAALAEMLATQAWLRLRYRNFPDGVEARPMSVRDRRKLALCWSTFVGTMDVDLVMALSAHARTARLAFAGGDVGMAALWWGSEAQRIGCMSLDFDKALEASRNAHRLAAMSESELKRVEVQAWTAAVPFLSGRPALDLDRLIEAEQILARRGQQADKATRDVSLMANCALYHAGRLRSLSERAERGIKTAIDRGDFGLLAASGSGFANAIWLARDDAEGASRVVSDIEQRSPHRSFRLQDFFHLVARTHTALYGGGTAAKRGLDETRRVFKRSSQHAFALTRMVHLDLEARALVAAQGPRVDPRELQRLQRKLDKLGSPMGQGHTAHAAAAHAVLFERERAPLQLTEAVRRYEEAGMLMHAAALRFARGKLVEGDAGQEDMRLGSKFFVDQGVKQPEAFIRMLVPLVSVLD